MAYDKLANATRGEPSETIHARIGGARGCEKQRRAGTGLACNADMGPAQIREFCGLREDAQALMRAAMRQMHLSARAYHRILKLGRTIADLAGEEQIQVHHLAEALQYRPRAIG